MFEEQVLEHHANMFREWAQRDGTPEDIAANVLQTYHRETLDFYGLEIPDNRIRFIANFARGIKAARQGFRFKTKPDRSGFKDFICRDCVQRKKPTGPLCYHYRGKR